jgi:hypothetical protein
MKCSIKLTGRQPYQKYVYVYCYCATVLGRILCHFVEKYYDGLEEAGAPADCLCRALSFCLSDWHR